MHALLVFVLLLALFFDTAAATSPMDPTLSAASLDALYPEAEGMLDYCLCIDICSCLPNASLQRMPTFTPETFTGHPEWIQLSSMFDELAPELPQATPYYPSTVAQPLADDVVRQLNDNGTTIKPSTVQIHVESTYNPGDRLQPFSRAPSPAGSRRPPHRRQAPRKDGFSCPVEGCGETFDRSCELKRHQKKHLARSERPHKCAVCGQGFLYPKDLNRHQPTHARSLASKAILHCPIPGCANVDGFSRRDNLLRHQRNQHPQLASA